MQIRTVRHYCVSSAESNRLRRYNSRMQSTDIAIVGAGPIGIELAVALRRAGADYLHFDAGQIGGTIQHWPRNTTFFSSPDRIAIAGVPIQSPAQSKITGEQYLAYLRAVVEQFDLPIRTYERVIGVERDDSGFLLTTDSRRGTQQIQCRRLVLATGDMAHAHRLNIPGEDLPHVSHYFREAHTYFRQKLLVVGGRNSAAEAALRCWRAGADVTLSYRRPGFIPKRVKSWIGPELELLGRQGRVDIRWSTTPVEITPTEVVLAATDAEERIIKNAPASKHTRIPADFVLLLTGYEADHSLPNLLGVTINPETQGPVLNRDTMETDIPGVYTIGTAIGGNTQRYTVFIENSHEHVARVVKALTGQDANVGGPPRRAPHETPVDDREQ